MHTEGLTFRVVLPPNGRKLRLDGIWIEEPKNATTAYIRVFFIPVGMRGCKE